MAPIKQTLVLDECMFSKQSKDIDFQRKKNSNCITENLFYIGMLVIIPKRKTKALITSDPLF